jgi:hypothetical protein
LLTISLRSVASSSSSLPLSSSSAPSPSSLSSSSKRVPLATPLDVSDARAHVLSRLASGPCSRGREDVDVDDVPSVRSGTTIGMLPARSATLDALPLLPTWFWEPVSRACGELAASPLAATAVGLTRPSAEVLAGLSRALNSAAVVESIHPELVAGMPLDVRVGCLLEVAELGHGVVSAKTIEPLLKALVGVCASATGRRRVMRWTRGDVGRGLAKFHRAVEDFTSVGYCANDEGNMVARVLALTLQQDLPVEFRLEAFRNDRFLELCEVRDGGGGGGGRPPAPPPPPPSPPPPPPPPHTHHHHHHHLCLLRRVTSAVCSILLGEHSVDKLAPPCLAFYSPTPW